MVWPAYVNKIHKIFRTHNKIKGIVDEIFQSLHVSGVAENPSQTSYLNGTRYVIKMI
jgi:hypothetical protein